MEISKAPAFLIFDPEGAQTRQEIHEFPFRLGRHSSNQLVLRDARASRHHAELSIVAGDFVLEDLHSRHGVFVNGERIDQRALKDGDRVEFGFADSFSLRFERPGSRVTEIAEHLSETDLGSHAGQGGNLHRLRAVLEVSRAIQNAFSVDSVLAAVIDAALVITRAERGFLLLKADDGSLAVRCARSREGSLSESDLKVPGNLIRKALDERSSMFSMQFDPLANEGSSSAFALELSSVVCIPLVRVKMSASPTEPVTPGETAGVLYMDSRSEPRDMAAGNRELLETLGIEASTVLENARLLEEERARRHLEEELAIARGIQQSLLPGALPETGWLRASGYTRPSRQVGGDYYDLLQPNENCRAFVVADVAGKGVSSALGASLLQGAFLATDDNPDSLRHTLARLNTFFLDRTGGEKYATTFCGLINNRGELHYINAGHPAPILVPLNDVPEALEATAPPVGMLPEAVFALRRSELQPGDRIVIFSDGVSEARNSEGTFFGCARISEIIRSHGDRPCHLLHQAILDAVENFTGGQDQADDLTLVVLEYRPD